MDSSRGLVARRMERPAEKYPQEVEQRDQQQQAGRQDERSNPRVERRLVGNDAHQRAQKQRCFLPMGQDFVKKMPHLQIQDQIDIF